MRLGSGGGADRWCAAGPQAERSNWRSARPVTRESGTDGKTVRDIHPGTAGKTLVDDRFAALRRGHCRARRTADKNGSGTMQIASLLTMLNEVLHPT
ncbi:hypothetical protein KCP77_20995 [Salmonella enterica subsp. enterica]|nr:hypothetical protein KCP77_20995 [Salmonella enterica subsp. enterica]